MPSKSTDVWVTGIGLMSAAGEGTAAHLAFFDDPGRGPLVDEAGFAPYPVHRMAEIDMTRQIPKKSDLKQMETWQRIGVYAAGLALADAGIAQNPELLSRTHLVVAAGSGERDAAVDAKVLDTIAALGDTQFSAKEILPTALRPTLFLAQLSNLLAGNISIVHNVTASSRTFMGEEMAGLSAVENAVRRISAGQTELVLVGGALNAERKDLLLGYELGRNLWPHPYAPVWNRNDQGGGFIPGSAGAFLVLEARPHAEARGVRAYARIDAVVTDRAERNESGDIRASLSQLFTRIAGNVAPTPIGVLSGASGVQGPTEEEQAFLGDLGARDFTPAVRAFGSRLGHTVEAQFPLGLALAALALGRGRYFASADNDAVEQPLKTPLQRVLVTGVGHWRGEGLALLGPVDGGRIG